MLAGRRPRWDRFHRCVNRRFPEWPDRRQLNFIAMTNGLRRPSVSDERAASSSCLSRYSSGLGIDSTSTGRLRGARRARDPAAGRSNAGGHDRRHPPERIPPLRRPVANHARRERYLWAVVWRTRAAHRGSRRASCRREIPLALRQFETTTAVIATVEEWLLSAPKCAGPKLPQPRDPGRRRGPHAEDGGAAADEVDGTA
jgi:hypothetical protein